ncbi:alpha/beta fold hydrolase [Solimonas sp. K1W22B-7]|uniref:alpha/beta fold hydrolase n=1 Tax=Solimonas sp. K1W22B-7 TaxID=2303331 RepID=UPI000E330D71|nr:alpha/beta hydrolase [Solimonas sp. K1W22B-7]AXQ29364.1 alpha/beta fold hydrolase [Solimonas sp. K1W22B-7]
MSSNKPARAALAPVRSGYLAYGQYRLAYEVWGEPDGIPALLVHGILLDAGINRGIARRMAAEGYRVILLDLLGHGRSDKTSDPKEHRAEFYADQVIAALDHFNIDKALVGGMSLGSITSLHVAQKAPERLLGLFLEMPVMEWSTPWAAFLLGPVLIATRYAERPYGWMAQAFARIKRPRNDLLATLLSAVSLPPRNVAAILHGVLVGPLVPPLAMRRAITVPTLVIGHGGDKLHGYRDSESLARQIPNARLLPAKHILEMRLHPERVWPEISRFLKEVAESLPASGPQRKPRRRQG